MYGKVLDEQEKRETLHRLALKRQQSNNFYLSESAKNVSNNKSSISAAERKAIRNRLATRPAHTPPRPKSPMGLGHQSLTSPHSAISRTRAIRRSAKRISSRPPAGPAKARVTAREGVPRPPRGALLDSNSEPCSPGSISVASPHARAAEMTRTLTSTASRQQGVRDRSVQLEGTRSPSDVGCARRASHGSRRCVDLRGTMTIFRPT